MNRFNFDVESEKKEMPRLTEAMASAIFSAATKTTVAYARSVVRTNLVAGDGYVSPFLLGRMIRQYIRELD